MVIRGSCLLELLRVLSFFLNLAHFSISFVEGNYQPHVVGGMIIVKELMVSFSSGLFVSDWYCVSLYQPRCEQKLRLIDQQVVVKTFI